jgi:branched-chain amino acid transport system permease protein
MIDRRAAALRPRTGAAFLRAWLPVLACIALAGLLQLGIKPLVVQYLNPFYSKLLLDIGTNIILAVSLTIVNGFTGQFSIGHAAFMAVGAYTTAGIVYYGSYRLWGDASLNAGILSSMTDAGQGLFARGDLLYFVSLLAGGVAAAVCGYLVGLPSLRLKGDYLAIVTLGFGEIVRVLIQQTGDVLYDPEEIGRTPLWKLPTSVGGALGFAGLPSYSSLFWAWLFAGITLLVAYRLKISSYGRAFLSIREDEVAAEAMGVNTTRYKVWAFVIAAFFAGIAGGIYAHTLGVQLTPNELGFQKSFDIIIMVVLGGMGSISGAAIAAVILTVLPELLRDPPSVFHPASLILIGLALVLLAIFARRKLRAVVVLLISAAAWEVSRTQALAYGVNLADYRMVLYALALILMMILRPQGLLGLREVWDLWRSKGFAKGLCQTCGYNVADMPTGELCPECGAKIIRDTAAAGESGRAGEETML